MQLELLTKVLQTQAGWAVLEASADDGRVLLEEGGVEERRQAGGVPGRAMKIGRRVEYRNGDRRDREDAVVAGSICSGDRERRDWRARGTED